jgi:hypothetical protein
MLFLSNEEHRRSTRKWVTMAVRIRAGGSAVDGVTINVSNDGMYVFAAAKFLPGAEVEISYHPLDSKEAVRTYGIVRRRAVYLYAIEFVKEISPAARRRYAATDETFWAP